MRFIGRLGILVMGAFASSTFAACSSHDGGAGDGAATGVASAPRSVTATVNSRGETIYFGEPAAPSAGLPRNGIRRRTDVSGVVVAGGATPGDGWNPRQLQELYRIPSSGGPSSTIAIVDFNDNPNVEADLGTYRAQWGLPSCDSANGCFQKVNVNGAASPLPPQIPQSDPLNQAIETTLDVEAASVTCPTCNILLIEVVPGYQAFFTAWQTAVNAGARFISNSWGTPESGLSGTTAAATDSQPVLSTSGVTFFAAAGDFGFGAQWPSTSAHFTSVGGTVVSQTDASPWWSQTIWSASGAGCSSSVARPSWQPATFCGSFRAVNDISAIASNFEIYNSWSSGGWTEVAGTSIATPISAGIYATNGWTGAAASYSYSHTSSFQDITTGAIGSGAVACAGTECDAEVGYDAPTGNGTPLGKATYADALVVNPSPITTPAGGVTTASVTASGTWVNDSAPGVTYKIASAPSDLNASLGLVNGSETLTLKPAASDSSKSESITLEATASNITHQIKVTVNVTAPDTFYITPDVLDVSAGTGAGAKVVVGSWAAKAGYTVSGPLPSGTEAAIEMEGTTPYFVFGSSGAQSPQTLVYTVKGIAGDVTNTTSVTVNLTKCVPQGQATTCANAGATCGEYQDICGNSYDCGSCGGSTPYCTYGTCTTCQVKPCFNGEYFSPEICGCMACACGTIEIDGALKCDVCRPQTP